MPLSPGTKLGPYEIIELIGAGGMGEVYRAVDTRLHRDVAIKVSAEAFSERFEREARVIASLNHPNICTLFDVGPNYLVMELIEGPTLADRINEGPIPLDQALPIARQIADALEAAHEKGIVHRDLKPGNVKITVSGAVKVLDFGLAKIAGDAPAAPSGNSPLTVTMGATQAGMMMGTASYMSPEQAKGKPVDKRADIWAFGVVLHEMLTGKKLFERESLSETLAGVLMESPDLTLVPPQVRPLLQRCLEKDPKKRLRDIGDAMVLLDSAPEPVAPALAPTALPPPPRRQWLWPSIAALFLLTTLVLSFIHFRETPPPAPLMHFTIPAPEKNNITTGLFAVSPNGRYVIFHARGADGMGRLWLRDLEETEAKPLSGTEHFANIPFWSPDSRFVAFDTMNASIRRLEKIDVTGGPPQVICDLPPGGNSALGGTWNRDGVILFGSDRGIMRVSAAGGVPTPVVSLNPAWKERLQLSPSFLPDGKHFLYSRLSNASPDKIGLYEGSLDAKPDQQNARLLPGLMALYVPSLDSAHGQVLSVRDGSMMAQAFDNQRGAFTGSPVVLAEHIGTSGGGAWGRFSASSNGVLVYQTDDIPNVQLTWYDRNGKVLGTVGDPARYQRMILSRDGTKAVLNRIDPLTGSQDLWLVDLVQGTATRFTFGTYSTSPLFSPDGSRVAFVSVRNGVGGLYEKASNGSGSEDLLVKGTNVGTLSDWTNDGRFLIYGGGNPFNTWVLPLAGDRKPFPFARTQFTELSAHLSPDDHFIAYASNESGRNEVYVKPFTPEPDAGSSAAKWLISRNGTAGMVHWRKDGKELFYLGTDGNVMAVDISTTPTFHAGVPKALFAVPPAFMRLSGTPGTLGDVSPDGQRFLFALPPEKNGRDEFSVILNWTEKLKR